jgi:hypothetical protein
MTNGRTPGFKHCFGYMRGRGECRKNDWNPADGTTAEWERRRTQNDTRTGIDRSGSLRLIEGNMGGPGTSCRERASSGSPVRVCKHPSARRNGNCQRSITKLSFVCYLEWNTVTREALLVAPLRTSPCLALSVVRSSDCPEGAAGNRARTCFGGPAACSWLVDAWLPDLKHPRKR